MIFFIHELILFVGYKTFFRFKMATLEKLVRTVEALKLHQTPSISFDETMTLVFKHYFFFAFFNAYYFYVQRFINFSCSGSNRCNFKFNLLSVGLILNGNQKSSTVQYSTVQYSTV